ncbi:MAG: hypothetical protein KKB81_08390 [Candidatus Margulisbacteria bacterium]|nr:hypothetical protein [Candidatus Margulisiibacteriota bacterium]
MPVSRMGPRLTVKKQMQGGQPRSHDFHPLRGRELVVEVRDRRGRTLRASDVVGVPADRLAAKIASLQGVLDARAPQISEMVAIPGMPGISIMKGEGTVGLFRQVMGRYEITGHNAAKLVGILADAAKIDAPLTYVSLNDSRALAEELNRLQIPGRGVFSVQTEAEWLAARDMLSGNNWTSTETPYSDQTFILRFLEHAVRTSNILPDQRYPNLALRLVEKRNVG